MKLFPAFDEVFYQADDIHQMLFFPLLSVDLDALNKGDGKVHFISVYCSGNPELVYRDKQLFNYNTICFDWDGERYHFQGDLSTIECFDKIPEWYEEAVQEYSQYQEEYCRVKDWQETKNSNYIIQCKRREKIDFNYFHYIKSVINYWVTRDNYLQTQQFIQGATYLENLSNHERKPTLGKLNNKPASNRSNELIGKVCGYDYMYSGEDEIGLYIDRKNHQVYEKFNWT